MTPDGAWELGAAMTAPDARGRGIQRALLDAGFAAAREAGARHSITDWRTANLLSSRSWTAFGYRPTHFRLHRAVDPRVAWAGRPG
jgi:GNAT superfamily N-acetyltransferase